MAKVEIKSDKCITSVLLNGTDIGKTLSGVDLRLEAGRLPEMILHSVPVPALKSVLNNVSVKSSPDLLQIAAEILRTEFLQKGDWYNALIDSIAQYLKIVPNGTGVYDVARGLADLIIGIETESFESGAIYFDRQPKALKNRGDIHEQERTGRAH